MQLFLTRFFHLFSGFCVNRISNTLLAFVLLSLSHSLYAQSDIWLFDIKKNNVIDLTSATNITDRVGYDNQPFFSADGNGLYYTKMMLSFGLQQADIYYYDFVKKTHRNITRTIQSSEYSPTESVLGNNELSIIKVEPDGVQRLWTVDTVTAQQKMLNRQMKPVGYHAWGKHQDLLLFVLGEPMTLQYLANYTHRSAVVMDNDIGRSIRYNASKDWFTYSKGTESQQVVFKFDQNFNSKNELIALPPRSQYYTWFNNETLITATQNKLMTWQLDTPTQWQPYADLSKVCQFGITRIAVNKNTTRIAVVCNEA